MIRFIAAIDSKKGIADENGIPWQGRVPGDVAYFRKRTLNSNVLMGFGTHLEFASPLGNRRNYVATTKRQALRAGFERVADAGQFLSESTPDVWVIGGEILFRSALKLADELYLTRLDADFSCTKFFPDFEARFILSSKTEPVVENNITYHMEVWKRTN